MLRAHTWRRCQILGRGVSTTRGSSPREARTNLRPDVTHFVGREREIGELMHVHHDTRLLSLLGPAGVGKTRLAIRLATTIRRQFPDGAWLVRLAPVADGVLLPGVITEVLGIPEGGPGETLAILEAALSSRHMLLVLDSCEHLADHVAVVVDQLLHGCPRLTIIATSRERLGLDAERVWRVPPLETPRRDHPYDPEELGRVESVALFVDRARRVNPGFAIVEASVAPLVELIRRLDGLPLAVELAATWMEAVSPGELVSELDDRYQILVGRRAVTEWQASLRAAIESSHGRLDPAAQGLFHQLGLFAGGWNLGAMTAVCRLESGGALEVLGRLVDHSLVSVVPTAEGPTRYRLLEVLRWFALDSLQQSGQFEEAQRRFVDHFVSLAETASPHLTGREGPRWLARLDAELENIRAVFAIQAAWAVEPRLRLAAALVPYWHFRGLVNEGRLHLRELEAVMESASPAAVRVLNGLSWLAWAQGDLGPAARHARAAFRRARRLGDARGGAYALLRLAQAQYDAGRLETSGRTTSRARQVADDLGYPLLQAECHLQVGSIALVERRLDEAERLLTESVRLFSLSERLDREAVALLVLGRTYLAQERAAAAEEALRRSLSVAREFMPVRHSIPILESLAALAADGRNYQRAATLVGAAAGLLRRVGARPPATAPMRAALAARWEPALRAPGADRAHAAGHAMDLPRAISYALGESAPPAARPHRATGAVREILTRRQLEIARLLPDGLSSKEIATRLNVSERTIEGHIETIFNRLGFNSRQQIVAWILRHDMQEQ